MRRSLTVQIQRIGEIYTDHGKTNGAYETRIRISPQTWRNAQVRYLEQQHLLMYRKALASKTMIDELKGDSIPEKKADMPNKASTYLALRRNVETTSDSLEKKIDFEVRI